MRPSSSAPGRSLKCTATAVYMPLGRHLSAQSLPRLRAGLPPAPLPGEADRDCPAPGLADASAGASAPATAGARAFSAARSWRSARRCPIICVHVAYCSRSLSQSVASGSGGSHSPALRYASHSPNSVAPSSAGAAAGARGAAAGASTAVECVGRPCLRGGLGGPSKRARTCCANGPERNRSMAATTGWDRPTSTTFFLPW
mmetsp:Transcript_8917/g.24603  ORF Transcript_8917/g.24603 Transcript_8917/m.24603 type:complete len:201 (+) Transcript_8917:389-991(+)